MNISSFWKRMFFMFMLIEGGISITMGVGGMIMVPGETVPYYAFFIPFLFAALCMIPVMLLYTEKEMTIKQAIIRKIIMVLLLEILVLLAQRIISPSATISLYVCVFISVFVIVAVVGLITWLYDKEAADQMNEKLKKNRKKDEFHEEK